MKLLPQEKELKKWISLVPRWDILFFKSAVEAKPFLSLGLPFFTVEEGIEQGVDLFGLNGKSWYGYSLGKSSVCAKFPMGFIESLEPEMQMRLLKSQVRLKVPTVFEMNGRQYWITSGTFHKLSGREKLKVLKSYYQNHPLAEKYTTIPHESLPADSQKLLSQMKLKKWLNSFPGRTGPNCFATVAHAISEGTHAITDLWLHWPPLMRFLEQQGYGVTSATKPMAGDILIFKQGDQAVHGCIYIGNDLVFEKPGQDFYEPYLISTLKKSKSYWRGSQIEIWRFPVI